MALLLDLLVTGQTRLNDDTYAKDIYADKFIKTGSSDSYVLLGGGGHKLLSDIYKVTQTVTTASNTSWRPFIVGMSYNDSEPFAPTTVTDTVYATHKLKMQPSTGNIQTYGYVKLYAASGDSPHLIFQRGTDVDGTYGWDQYVAGGYLKMRYNNAGTWTEMLSLYPGNNLLEGYAILTAGNSSVSGGGSSWGSSITVKINGISKTLTIPSNPNTDTFVQQSRTTSSNLKPLLMGYTEATSVTSLDADVTNKTYVSSMFYAKPSTGELYATTFVGSLEGGASLVKVNQTNPTSATWYYPTWTSGYTANTDYSLRANNGFMYSSLEGTASVTGVSILRIGNDINQGTAGNKIGILRVYGHYSYFGDIYGPDSDSVSIFMPNTGGSLVTQASRGDAVGNTAQPVYIANTGRATALSATKGSDTTPVFLNAGVITACSSVHAASVTCSAATTNYDRPIVGTPGDNKLYHTTKATVNWSTGNITAGAFYESSDERLKVFYDSIDIDFDKLSALPKKFFKWKSNPNGEFEIGTSAQELQKIYPHIVNVDSKGYLTVAYDKLSIVALKAIDKLYEMNKNLEKRIQILESKK